MALKENYKDDILDVSVNTKRKYRMTENPDGTVSFDDETEYTQEGDSFGASDMNATNGKVNTLESDIGEINDNLSGFKFYPEGTQLVALVADDSFYKDANDKYVLADSTTGQSMIDNVTYKALASTEDCRGEVGADTATPFNKDLDWTITRYIDKQVISGQNRTANPSITIPSGCETFLVLAFGYTQYGSLYFDLVTATNTTELARYVASQTTTPSYFIFKKNKNDTSVVTANNTQPLNGYGNYGLIAISLD